MRRYLCLFLLVCFASDTFALPDVIRIGGLFDSGDARDEAAFRYAVEKVNGLRNILPQNKLAVQFERLPPGDSFFASERVCQLLKAGVAGIFGPQSPETSGHVQSVCDALEVPHLEMRWNAKKDRDTYALNLYPTPETFASAYNALVKAKGWKTMVILYDSVEGLAKLHFLLKGPVLPDMKVTILQLHEGTNYRPLLREVQKLQEKNIIIDCETDRLADLLKQAQQIGLMTSDFSYIITSLDLHVVDLEDFRYGGTNITAMRLVDPTKPECVSLVSDWVQSEQRMGRRINESDMTLTTRMALIYDGVVLFAKALHELDRSQEISIRPLSCDSSETSTMGNSLANYMRLSIFDPTVLFLNQISANNVPETPAFSRIVQYASPTVVAYADGQQTVRFKYTFDIYRHADEFRFGAVVETVAKLQELELEGLTGTIKFDTQGFRSYAVLDIAELTDNGLQKVGVWEPHLGISFSRQVITAPVEIPTDGLRNKSITVTTILSAPYAMLKESPDQLTGNDRFEGMAVDIIDEISKILGFNYTFRLVEDNSWGSLNKETGEWNGMIREVMDGKADMAIGDLSINYERGQVVDFSTPWMNTGISILYKKPRKAPPSLFSFMSPFSLDVWLWMSVAYLGVSVVLYLLARLSPYEWTNPYPCIEDPVVLENQFNLLNSMWFTIGSLMQQGSDIAPKAVSTRMVAGIWWFFTLIMISSYTANLAAFLTVERMESPIESAEDLVRQTKIKYGSVITGSTTAFFRDSKIPTYQKMYQFMEATKPSVFLNSNGEGVERVQKSDGLYAFLMESSSIEFQIERKCDLTQVGGLLDFKGYGIALPQGSPYRTFVSEAILKLQETNRLLILKNKWWKQRRGGGQCKDEASGGGGASELNLANVGGVFLVLIVGMGTGTVIALLELLSKIWKNCSEDKGISFKNELKEEVRFIVKCSGNTKPVRKRMADSDSKKYYRSSTSTLERI